MKTTRTITLLLACIGLASTMPAWAQTHTETYNFNGLDLDITDGDTVGVSNTQTLNTQMDMITDFTVSVHISATEDGDPIGFNGDLYAYLLHSSGFAVLLDRTGRTILDDAGYDDNGLDVTFSDTAPNGDIHVYQDVTTPGAGLPLTGLWQPGGRITDPLDTLDTDPRSAFLSSFTGLDADGDWTLFIADLSGGQEHTLESWSLQFTGIPEPTTSLLLAAGLPLLLRRRRA